MVVTDGMHKTLNVLMKQQTALLDKLSNIYQELDALWEKLSVGAKDTDGVFHVNTISKDFKTYQKLEVKVEALKKEVKLLGDTIEEVDGKGRIDTANTFKSIEGFENSKKCAGTENTGVIGGTREHGDYKGAQIVQGGVGGTREHREYKGVHTEQGSAETTREHRDYKGVHIVQGSIESIDAAQARVSSSSGSRGLGADTITDFATGQDLLNFENVGMSFSDISSSKKMVELCPLERR